MAKRWIPVIVLVLLVGAGVAFWQRDKPEPLPAGFSYVTPRRLDVSETVTAQGKLEPKSYVDVGAQVSGQLSRLHVEIGDVVDKDQLIAEIDPRIFASRVASDQARIASLTAQLAQQQAEQGGLAAAIGANQAHSLPSVQLKRRVSEKEFGSAPDADLAEL